MSDAVIVRGQDIKGTLTLPNEYNPNIVVDPSYTGEFCLKCKLPLPVPENHRFINVHRWCLSPIDRDIEEDLDLASIANPNLIIFKECCKCHDIKLLSEFRKHKRMYDNRDIYCRVCMRIADAKYRELNHVKKRNYDNSRKLEDQNYKLRIDLTKDLQRCIKIYLKDNTKVRHAYDILLGCTIPDYVKYLESLWEPGMSWHNWGVQKVNGPWMWHIDHIKPRSSFDLSDPTGGYKKKEYTPAQLECFNYKNTRPLWANFNNGYNKLNKENSK